MLVAFLSHPFSLCRIHIYKLLSFILILQDTILQVEPLLVLLALLDLIALQTRFRHLLRALLERMFLLKIIFNFVLLIFRDFLYLCYLFFYTIILIF